MLRRGSSSEDTDSTTTASRRDSEDSDSGVGNLSEKETQLLGNLIIINLCYFITSHA